MNNKETTILIALSLITVISFSAVFGPSIVVTLGKSEKVLNKVPTPYEILGYNVGEDGKLTYWNQILEYNYAVAEASNRVEVYSMGETELGKQMIYTVITSPSNWAKMDHLREIIQALSDPRETSPELAKSLAEEGKPIVWVTCNQHSTETGSAEMSIDLLYKLASSQEKEVLEVLDKIIIIIDPSINPDGHDMMTEWHYEYADTEWKMTTPPYYQKYVSHDNNRDWFTTSIIENVNNEIAMIEWRPQVHWDLHESGPARIYVPPGPDPYYPEFSPIIRSSWIMMGGYIITQACTKGLPGYVCGTTYDKWYPAYGGTWPAHQLAISETFETNGGRWAGYSSPKSFERLGVLWNQPMPWTGGWWTMYDNINYQEGAVWSTMELASRIPDKILWSFYQAAYQMVEKGASEPPYAYLVPPEQKDVSTMAKMLNRLIFQNIEVHVATEGFMADGDMYPAGTYIIRMDQPLRGYAKTLLEVQYYKDEWPRPYDATAWTLPYAMGVETIECDDPTVLSVGMSPVSEVVLPGSVSGEAEYAYAFSHATNTAIIAVNRLHKAGYNVYMADETFTAEGVDFDIGTIIVPLDADLHGFITDLAYDLGLQVYAIDTKPDVAVYEAIKPEIGVFYSYRSTMDEGWTRLLLDDYEFEYTRLNSNDVKTVDLSQFDVIVIPRMRERDIVDGYSPGSRPPEYTGGIGSEGIELLRAYVEAGGLLVCEDLSSALPINNFAIGVSYADITGAATAGSILAINNIDSTHPIGYGYFTGEGAASMQSASAFDVTEGTILATYYSEGDPFLSGYLVHGDILQGKPAAVVTPLGDGEVVLFAFRVLQRSQSDNTFQLFFNSIHYSGMEASILP